MSTMKDIATDPTAAYHRWLELGGLLADASDAHLFPAMEHIRRDENEDESVDYLKCPHCGMAAQTVEAHDVANRISESNEPDFERGEVNFYYDGSDFEGFVYLSTCCGEPVSLPIGWREI